MSIKMLYRKVTFRFLKMSSLLISTILGIIFGSGCVKTEDISAAYGPRSADYKVSGTVVSSDQNLPIKGLEITLRDTRIELFHYSTRTDSLGKYSFESSGPFEGDAWELNVKDIDSTENGSFIAKDTIISMSHIPKDSAGYGNSENVDIKLDRM
jgi:putative lipoprotein (rSAM/lipoprotein system)